MTDKFESKTAEVQLGYTCFRNDEWCPITWPSRVCVPEISGCFYLMHDVDNARTFIRVNTSFGNWEYDLATAGGCQPVWSFGIGEIQICIKDVVFAGGKLTSATIELKACLPYNIGCTSIYSYKFTISYIASKSDRKSLDLLIDEAGRKNLKFFEAFVLGETLVQAPTASCRHLN